MTDDLEAPADAPKECSEPSHIARVVAFHPLTGEPDDRGVESLCDYAVLPEDVSAIPVVATPKPVDGVKPEAVKGIELRLSTIDGEPTDFFLTRATVLAMISQSALSLNLTERIDVSIVVDDEPEPHRRPGAYL